MNNELNEMFDLIQEDLKNEKERYQFNCKRSLAWAANRLFMQYPDITMICWTQYTPYFMDGDPCEFSTNEICYHAHGRGVEKETLENNYGYELYWESSYNENGSFYPDDTFEKIYSAFCDIIIGNQEAMKEIFGDHVAVFLINRENDVEVIVEDYNHE